MQSPNLERRLLRLKDILHPRGPLPLAKATFYAAIKAGRAPAPVKLGRISAWREEEILRLVEEGIPPATKGADPRGGRS